MRIKSVLAAVATCAAMAASAPAATMNYLLSYDDDGTGTPAAGRYAVYAWSSLGDNSGFASFNFTVTGQTSTVNRAPQARFVDDAGNPPGDDRTSGYTLLRQTGGSGLPTTGSFDTVSGNGLLVYGVGQTSGNVRNAAAPAGYVLSGGTAAQGAYGVTKSFDLTRPSPTNNGFFLGFGTPTGGAVPYLLATGTYTPTLSLSQLTLTAGLSALFNTSQNGTSSLPTSTVLLVRGTPEPASLAAVAVVGAGLLRRRRRDD